jgi:hypothetical protein
LLTGAGVLCASGRDGEPIRIRVDQTAD